MRPTHPRLAFAYICAIAALGTTVDAAWADTPKERASALYNAGIVSRDAGELDKACVSFGLSVNTHVSPDALLEAAACRARDNDATDALTLYERAIALAKKSTKRRVTSPNHASWLRVAAIAKRKAATLRATKAVVVINIENVPSGAWVAYAIDDQRLDNAMLARPLLLPAGQHVFAADRPACASYQVTKNVRAGKTYRVKIPKLECNTNAVIGRRGWYYRAGPPRQREAPDSWLAPSRWRSRGGTAIIGGLAAVSVGLVLQLKSNRLTNEARGCQFTTLTCDPAPIQDSADTYHSVALTTMIGGGLVVLAGIVMRRVGGGPVRVNRKHRPKPKMLATAKADVALRNGGAVLQLSGAF